MQNIIHTVGEYLTPTLKKSNFLQTGRLTPEEFVAAGDYLVYKCPTWSWAAGEVSRRKSYLPADKQLLITRNVPSLLGLHGKTIVEETTIDGDGFSWISTAPNDEQEALEEAMDLLEIGEESEKGDLIEEVQHLSPAADDNEEIPDLDAFDGSDNLVVLEGPVDPSEFHPQSKKTSTKILQTRTFDLSLTYDKYYQTPRLWLTGYSESGAALPPASLLAHDVSAEHARKTVTVETHPGLGLPMASVHPCRHAHVMRRMVERMMAEGGAEVRVDQYLVIFLKFISTILPHIDYDHTM